MSQEDPGATDDAADTRPFEEAPDTTGGRTETPIARLLRTLLLVWGAGIAPLIIAALAVLQFMGMGATPEVKIKDLKTLIEVLEQADTSIRAGTFGTVSATDRELLAEKASTSTAWSLPHLAIAARTWTRSY